MKERTERQVPVRIYESDARVMLAAPMPGLEPEDISVTIHHDVVTIRGDYRGPLKEAKTLPTNDQTTLVLDEWSVGPYQREVVLPHAVHGELANATYGNGVLVLVMPKWVISAKAAPVEIHLTTVGAPHGEHVGHVGHDLTPAEMWGHLRRVHRIVGAPM